MYLSNFHTHSSFCDGKGEPRAYVEEAIKRGFQGLGFSGHAPLPFSNNFSISKEDLQAYCTAVKTLKGAYSDKLEIYLSLEADYIPGISWPFEMFHKDCKLDYIIGSVHLVKADRDDRFWFIDGPKYEIYDEGLRELFSGDIKKGVTAYYHQINEMIEAEKPDIVGHLDKIKMHNKERWFSEDDKWYQSLWHESLELIKEKQCLLEVNTRGLYKGRSDSLFPGESLLKECLIKKIPLVLNSDAHKPEELEGFYAEAMKQLKDIGLKELFVLINGEWEARAF